MKKHDIVIIGGGAGGLAAAQGASAPHLDVLLLEKDARLGGILNQCIHTGFGLQHYKEELTGPEYAQRAIRELEGLPITIKTNTTVIAIEKTTDFTITYTNESEGETTIRATACILTTGSFERTRGAIKLPGTRPKGIITAGSAQRYLNIDGYLVGKNIFILGSGDIGLIMARRLTLEGAQVLGVAEILPHASGLTRNIVQCLHDYDIPLYLSHTVTDIRGAGQLRGITISEVDANFQKKPHTEKHFEVDTLMLSVGLIPDITAFNGLSFAKDNRTNGALVNQTFETSLEGLFAAGNALHIHDLVDDVSAESLLAGKHAKAYLENKNQKAASHIDVLVDEHINYCLPQRIQCTQDTDPITFSLRVKAKHEKATLKIMQGDKVLMTRKRQHLAPAEMERITFKNVDRLDDQTPLSLKLEVS